jgi:hypothetical protein
MVLLALVFGLFFVSGQTLFDAGGAMPATGMGEVVRAPKTQAGQGRARLSIKRILPTAVIAGTGFKSSEVVRFTGVAARPVRASARGTFTIRVRSVDPCQGLSVRATGSKGSRAAVSYSQLYCAVP